MKTLHWIIFSFAFWIVLAPTIGHKFFQLATNQSLTTTELINALSWNGFMFGLTIAVLALIVVTLEQATKKSPGLIAMHWLQVVLGIWIAIAAFTFNFDYTVLWESHTVSGILIAVFALLQINLEVKSKKLKVKSHKL